ncbi:tail completion protein gp17, partial [Bacillus toyonensis]
MINLRPEIVQALENNQELVSLLGGKRVYYRKAKHAEEFPRITFFELNNRPDGFADNEESESEITFQIDIWSKGSTTAIHQKVNE